MQGVKDQWVQIYNVVLGDGARASQAPEDTQALPLEMWVKGYLVADARLNETCTIVTPTGRHATGKLVEIEPGYHHGFGEYVPELDQVRRQVRAMLAEGCSKGASGV